VRIALALKGLSYENVPIDLRWADGDHDQPSYKAFNPQANVPVLVEGDARIMQSLAILE
jgi:glutathione S-transferase